MKVLRDAGSAGNVLVTIAIGDRYFSEWQQHAMPGWKAYCDRHDLGLVVFDQEMLEKDSEVWKKATWQKLLIADRLAVAGLKVANVCYLDTDILISPFAPNVFDGYDPQTIAVVSQVHDLLQPLHLTLRRLAFLRHNRWDTNYPLDSALFMSPRQIFEFHGLPAFENYFCAGMFVFNIESHRSLMKGWFEKYTQGVQSITGGGDEAHVNYEFQNWGKLSWLPYQFQALWTYEAAWHYPFLFNRDALGTNLVRECIEASLYKNHFLHFAGSWHECQMWKMGGAFTSVDKQHECTNYSAYLQTPVTAQPKGMIKPQ
jgi:hypothetical protein